MAAEFYRKVEPSKNVVLSSIFKDMHMARLQTANIGGGNREQAYLSRFTLPSNPTYGSAELDRFDYHVYVNSIDLAQNVYAFPEAAIYKTKDSKKLSLTEGTQRLNDTKTKDVLMFSSHLDGTASISEVFDGTKQAYGDAVKFIPVQRSIIRESTAYILPRHLASQGREITWGWGLFNNDNTSESDIRAKYGVKASELGITSIDDSGARSANQLGLSTVVCPVEEADDMKNWGKKNLDWVVNPLPGETGAKKIYIHRDTGHRIKYGDRSTIPSTELYGDELTPKNCIFEIVRGSKEFFGEQTKGEAAVELLATGAARLSTGAHLTGAQSGEMYTFWKKDTVGSEVTLPSKGEFIGGSTGSNGGTRATGAPVQGPENRQEVMLCKKNLLFPLKHPSKPYRRGTAASATSQDVNDFANNIEMDIKIKTLAKAYGFGNMSTGYYTLRRAFVICFSEEQPKEGESFFEFVWKHRDRNQITGAFSRAGGSSNHKLTSLMNYNTLDYGRPTGYTIVAGGTGYSASSTNATTLDLAAGSTIPSNGSGITVNTTVDHGVVTAAVANSSYPASTTGYKVGDILTLTGGDGTAKVKVATIERYTKGFAAVAFLDTDNGLLVSDSSIVGACTSSTKAGGGISTPGDGTPRGVGQSKQQWWLDETMGDVVIPKESFSTTSEMAESFVDQWVRLNFLTGAQSGRIVPHQSTNFTATAKTNGTGDASEELEMDNNVGTILVGDYVVGTTGDNGLLRVSATNGSTTATMDGTANWSDNQDLRFFTPNSGGFGKEVAGQADGTWGRLLVSQVSDGQLIQRTNELEAYANPDQFWAINSANGQAPYASLDQWTRYMSIWLLNYPSAHDVATDEDNLLENDIDMTSQVYIDRIAFKDFNYAVENPNFNDRNLYPDTISIKPDTAMIGPDGTVDDDSIRGDKISQYNANSPTMLSIGATDPTYLGYKNPAETAAPDHYNWCSDRHGWLMLHNFTTENLANLAEIPDENICATYTHASGLTAGKSKWGECYNTHYGMGGFMSEATNPALHHNGFEGFADSPATNIGLKYLWTGLEAQTSGSGTSSLLLQPSENDEEGPMGVGHRMHWPIRPGDTIVFPSGDDTSNETALVSDVDLSGSEATATITITAFGELNTGDKVNLVATDGTNYDFTCGDQSSVNGTWESATSNITTAENLMNVINTSSGPSGTRFTATRASGTAVVTVTQATAGSSGNTTVTLTDSGTVGMTKTNFTGGGDDDNYQITTAANVTELDAGDNVFIHPEGMVDNFSKKGMLFFDINAEIQPATTGGDFTSTSSVNWARRECGPVASRVLDVVDSTSFTVDFLVDSLKPLKLDVDEQYIIYVYGEDLYNTWFTTTDNISTTVNANASNAKSGIYIKSMDAKTNIVTLEWDGTANDGTTQMITERNLPALMISPYRHWIHMNVDCSSYASNAPTTTLPGRKYDAFSVMDNNFAVWDGSTYHTGVIDESLNATDVTFDVTDASDIAVGDTIMVNDEAMYIRATNTSGPKDTLTVIRGASGTYTDNVATVTSLGNLARTGTIHDNTDKIKTVTVHTAWGEYMSGNPTKMTKDGTLGGDGTAASGLTARRNLGSTYSEYLINHESSGGVNGAYINKWRPTVLEEGTVLETRTDFGFGSYDAAENTGGQLSNQILRSEEYNVFKLYDISSANDFIVDRDIDLLIKYKDDTVPHVTNINTRFSDTNKPYGVAVFKDTLPSAPILSVKPYKEDPFLPEFTWESSNDDLWYGLLHIDSRQIKSQYHNSILHLPFNEEGDHGKIAVAPKNKTYYNNSDTGTGLETSNMSISGPLYDIEGLAGNCLRFDGADDYVDYNPSSGNTFTDITDELTFIVHIIPDIDISGATNLICAEKPVRVNFDATTSQIDVRVHQANATYVELKSSAITVDGETPTAIIVTFDKNLKVGNCKLFIDGRLEDQSGAAMASMSSGANNNWRADSDAHTYTDPFRVGHATNAFDGRIEEVVVYNKCLYPVVPSDSSFVFSKPLKEISNSSPISYIARLFIKDYHNIRGSTSIEVASSSPVSWRKSAFRLVD